MSGKYDDIIHLPHHVSSRRRPMAATGRAAQFSPFAALTGYEAVIRETARQTQARMELDEDEKASLDRVLREAVRLDWRIKIVYFCPDDRKDGGAYVEAEGKVKRLDTLSRLVFLCGGESVPIDAIVDVLRIGE